MYEARGGMGATYISAIPLSPPPSPLPQFGYTPQPKWSGNKTDGFIDFHDMEWPVGEILTLFKNN